MIGMTIAQQLIELRDIQAKVEKVNLKIDQLIQRQKYVYGIWVRWKAGGTHAFEIAYLSYEYLLAIQGTELERDVVTLQTVRGDCLNINLADTSAYQIFRKERKPHNPLEDEEIYDDPLN